MGKPPSSLGQGWLRSRWMGVSIVLVILGLTALTVLQLERAARDEKPSVMAAFGKELAGAVAAAVLLAGVAVLVGQRRMQRPSLNKLQLRAALDAIPDPVWLKSLDGRYSICNSQFERCVGASEADLIGRTDYDLVDRRMADFFRENDRKALEAGEPRANEERNGDAVIVKSGSSGSTRRIAPGCPASSRKPCKGIRHPMSTKRDCGMPTVPTAGCRFSRCRG